MTTQFYILKFFFSKLKAEKNFVSFQKNSFQILFTVDIKIVRLYKISIFSGRKFSFYSTNWKERKSVKEEKLDWMLFLIKLLLDGIFYINVQVCGVYTECFVKCGKCFLTR